MWIHNRHPPLLSWSFVHKLALNLNNSLPLTLSVSSILLFEFQYLPSLWTWSFHHALGVLMGRISSRRLINYFLHVFFRMWLAHLNLIPLIAPAISGSPNSYLISLLCFLLLENGSYIWHSHPTFHDYINESIIIVCQNRPFLIL